MSVYVHRLFKVHLHVMSISKLIAVDSLPKQRKENIHALVIASV